MTPTTRKRRPVMYWVGLIAVVLLFGGAAAGGATSATVALLRSPHETATAMGLVVKSGTCGRSRTPARATFAVDDTTYTADVACDAQIGDQIQVRYDPADPGHNGDTQRSVYGFTIAGVGLIGLAIAVPGMVRNGRAARPARGSISA